jgi:type I restriction enzyme S subunit
MSVLPHGWTEATIDDLRAPSPNAITDGPYGSSLKTSHYCSEGARVIRLGNIGSREFLVNDVAYISQRYFKALAKHHVAPGDIIVAALGDPVGRACLAPPDLGPALVKADCFRVRTSSQVSAAFLMLWLNSDCARAAFSQSAHGMGRVRINLSDLRTTTIPVPPQAEQRRIVGKIDGLSTKSKLACDHLHHIPVLVEKYKQAILSAAFRGDLTAQWRAQHKLQLEYTVTEISGLATVVTGSTPPTKHKARFFGGSIPFFKPKDLDAGYHVLDARETLTEEGAAVSRALPQSSTLVTCIGATIGKTGFARVACCTNQQINGLVPDRALVLPEWLYWMVASPDFQRTILDNASATTLPIINKGRFERLLLPRPPLKEQREIVGRIERAFAWIERLAHKADNARKLIDQLDEAVLTKAFRGELVPQDPNDEPASVLVDRIRTERTAATAVDRPITKSGSGKASVKSHPPINRRV